MIKFIFILILSNSASYDLVKTHYYTNPNTVINAYETGLVNPSTADSTVWMYSLVTRSFINAGKYNQANDVFLQHIDVHLADVKDKNTLYNALLVRSRVVQLLYKHNDRYTSGQVEAIYKNTYSIIEQGYDSVASSLLINLSLHYWDSANYKEFKSTSIQALRHAQDAGDVRRQVIILTNLSEYFEKIEHNFDKMKEYATLASQLSDSNNLYESTKLRIRLRELQILRDINSDYENSLAKFKVLRADAEQAGINWLLEEINTELMRTKYLYERSSDTEGRFTLLKISVFICAIMLIFITVYYERKVRSLKIAKDGYNDWFKDSIDKI